MLDEPEGRLDHREEAVGVADQVVGLALGDRKARKQPDPARATALRETVAAEHRALPCMIAVAVVTHDDPEIREEDYAAVMMGGAAIADRMAA